MDEMSLPVGGIPAKKSRSIRPCRIKLAFPSPQNVPIRRIGFALLRNLVKAAEQSVAPL